LTYHSLTNKKLKVAFSFCFKDEEYFCQRVIRIYEKGTHYRFCLKTSKRKGTKINDNNLLVEVTEGNWQRIYQFQKKRMST